MGITKSIVREEIERSRDIFQGLKVFGRRIQQARLKNECFLDSISIWIISRGHIAYVPVKILGFSIRGIILNSFRLS